MTSRVIRFLAATSVWLVGGGQAALGQEFTEGNASQWTTFASDQAAASVTDDATRVLIGNYSLKFVTESGFDTGIRYPESGSANLDLTDKNFLRFWAYAENSNIGFQGNQPVVVLSSLGGHFRYEPSGTLMTNDAWRVYKIPLEGNAIWNRTITGSPNMANIDQIDIHQDTWDSGFTIYYDGLEFVNLNVDGLPPEGPPPPPSVNPDALEPRVLLFVYDPIMENMDGQRLHDAYGWGNPVRLAHDIVNDFQESSHDLVRYDLVEIEVVDEWPYLESGFQHSDESFAEAWTQGQLQPGTFDYPRFIADHGIGERVDRGEIDEVWVYAFPGAGMFESAMAGRGAYWINGGPYPEAGGERAFVIMGWNYERGVAEAFHSYGHRAENNMIHIYGSWESNQGHSWNRFTLLDRDAPGSGGLGNVHFPVNGQSDYDYANPRYVFSNADDWYSYPDLTGATRVFNYEEWSPVGKDAHREYLNWWYHHMPHFPSKGPDERLNNWWRYIVDVDQFKASDGVLWATEGIPSVWIKAPPDGSEACGVVTIRADVFVDGALGRVDLYVDDHYFATDTMAPFVFEWNATSRVGEHLFVAKAYELQNGTEGVSDPVSVFAGANGPADLNGDSRVDLKDFAAFQLYFTGP